jgi:tripartite-type tricarboxylate transporter receptor subunit TctC
MPQYKAVGWFGLMAPAGTPKEIIAKLNAAVEVAVKDKEVVAALRAQGIEPSYTKPAEFGEFVAEQLELHKKLVKDVDLKITD